MLIQEILEDTFWKNGLIKTYSDSNFYIVNAQGVKYAVAIDPKDLVDSGERTYTETMEEIPPRPTFPNTEEADA